MDSTSRSRSVLILCRKATMMSKNHIILCASLIVLLYGAGNLRYVYGQGTPVPAAERTATGIPYMSGGVGLDERDALRAVSGDYNLQVTCALREGNYLSDVHVLIQDATGATVLETIPQGPWLFTKLPPGKYTVMATSQGQAQHRSTHVPMTGRAEVYFYWSGGTNARDQSSQGIPVSAAERTATGIPYISGGVGLDERDSLRAISRDYNLQVTCALREGNYLSDVHMTIQDAKGATILDTVPQGPWLFTKLPPGHYTVVANLQGKAQQRSAHVPPTGHAEVYFYW